MTEPVSPTTLRRRTAGELFRGLSQRAETTSFAFLVIVVVVLCIVLPAFATPNNIAAVVSQVSVVGIIALAQNQVILAREIDISTGSVLALCAISSSLTAASIGGFWVPLGVSITIGAAIGAINGFLSTWARIPAIIVTLAALYVVRGMVLSEFGGVASNTPAEVRVLGLGKVVGIPYSVLLLLLVFTIFTFINRQTSWGKNTIALGGNIRAARMIGIPVNRTVFLTFVVSGISVGLASVVYIGQVGQVQATAGLGLELEVIAAVVIGGTSIMGGKGSSAAPLIGAILIGVIVNAMAIAGIPGVLNDLVLGALILLAITTDVVRRRLTKGSA